MLRVSSFDGSLFCRKDRFYLRINHKRKGIFIMWTLHFRQSPAIFPRFSPLAFGTAPTPLHPAHSFHHAPSSLVMKLRRKRELVGHFLRFPPRVLTPTRALRAHQSVFVFRLHPFTDMSESPHLHSIRGEDFYSRTFTLRALPCFPLGSDRSAKQPTGEGKVKVRNPKSSPLINSLTANCVTWVKA